jgi:hypothetical protein
LLALCEFDDAGRAPIRERFASKVVAFSDWMALANFATAAAQAAVGAGRPITSGLRTSSAKRSVSARRMPASPTIAHRYSRPRITKVAMPARCSFSSVAASRR